MMLQRSLDVSRQILHAQVAHRNSEIVCRYILNFVRLIENHRRRFRQNAGVGRAIGLQLDSKVREKQMMVDNDDVALHPSPAHLGDKASLPLAALLSAARLRARIQLVPKQAGLGQLRQLGSVSRPSSFLPCRTRAILLNLFPPASPRLIPEVVKLLTA